MTSTKTTTRINELATNDSAMASDDDDKEEKIVTKKMGAVSTPVQNALGEWVEDDEQREQKAPKPIAVGVVPTFPE